MKKVHVLSLITILLFSLSVLTYNLKHQRGEDLIAGSYFVTGLKSDLITNVKVAQPDEEIVLQKQKDSFVLGNHHGFLASNKEINNFLFDITKIQIRDSIGVAPKEYKDLLVDDNQFKLNVTFSYKNGKQLSFYIGKDWKGKGSYLRMAGEDKVYISDQPLYFMASVDKFIEKDIAKIDSQKIEEIRVKSDKELIFAKKADKFEVNLKNAKPEKVEEYVKGLEEIKFEKFLPPNDQSISKINFDKKAFIKLKNNIQYEFDLAQTDKKYYLKTKAISLDSSDQITISANDDVQKLKEVEEVIKSRGELDWYNRKNQNWIFEISEYEFKKLIKEGDDFKNI